MNKALFLAIAAALALGLAPAHAQLSRTFVSAASGNDANNCDRATPCRTFQRAHNVTNANGEITVLDPGGYGAVAIDRNVSIVNDGVGEAGILVSGGGVGIMVNAPADAAVTLRGLTVKGIGFGGGDGVAFSTGAALNLENCTIRNLGGPGALGVGLYFRPAGQAALQITNTIVTDNGNDGIIVEPRGGTAAVAGVLDRVGLYNNGVVGLSVNGTGAGGGKIALTMIDSVASNNGAPALAIGHGVQVVSDFGKAAARITLIRSAVVNNPVIVNQSAVSDNASAWVAELGGQIFTFGNNAVIGNGGGDGPQTPVTPK
jgi:hypothetical protein